MIRRNEITWTSLVSTKRETIVRVRFCANVARWNYSRDSRKTNGIVQFLIRANFRQTCRGQIVSRASLCLRIYVKLRINKFLADMVKRLSNSQLEEWYTYMRWGKLETTVNLNLLETNFTFNTVMQEQTKQQNKKECVNKILSIWIWRIARHVI